MRAAWLQVHKWIGLALAVLIIPISVTGSLLVWNEGLDLLLNPERNVAAAPTLTPATYAESARGAIAPRERILAVRMPEGEGAVLVTAARPPVEGERRPVRSHYWLDPTSGAVLDRSSNDAGAVRVLHVLHGRLLMPGVGREIVGWVGVAMLLSCLTGIWLWWPVTGSVRRGFRWRRQSSFNANLHHQMGFWVLVPLAMLSFTGVWISFPTAFGRFEASAPKARPAPPPPAQPVVTTVLTADQAVAAARFGAPGPLVSVGWPTERSAEWTIAFARQSGNAEVKVADVGGAVTPAGAPRPETTARTMRRWHDGTGMGPVWQLIIFLGGIIPAALSVTGILMWWRSRSWRGRARRRHAQPVAAE